MRTELACRDGRLVGAQYYNRLRSVYVFEKSNSEQYDSLKKTISMYSILKLCKESQLTNASYIQTLINFGGA